MKKNFLVIACLVATQFMAQAQDAPRGDRPGGPGGFRRMPIEERVKFTHNKLDSAFKPGADKLKELDAIFTEAFTSQDKMMQEMRSAGGERPDPQVMREKMRSIMEERDEKLKKAMTAEQFDIWKKQIEPSMRPQRGPRQ